MAGWLQQTTIVLSVAIVVYFTNLGGPLLWDRDEPRNAGSALEMLERGDWVVPVFNSELRSHKPVLLYWLIMSAYSALGVSEFAARFWSAVAGVGTVLATYAIGRRLFSGPAGMWAGIAVAANLMFAVASRAATPDALVIFLSTLSITLYVCFTFAGSTDSQDAFCAPRLRVTDRYFPARWWQAAAIYAVMGLAMLAKGPVGMVLPTAVIGMFLLIVRLPAADQTDGNAVHRWLRILRPFAPFHFLRTCWLMRPLTAVAVSLAVAAPWYIWVGLRTDGEFLRGFFWEHNLGRAMATMEGHDGGLLFYPVSLLVGFFPWSVFAAPLLIDAARRVRGNDAWRLGYLLAACWVGVYLTAFSLARTKLPSYITPCYPAAALATGAFVVHWIRGDVWGALLWRRLSAGVLTVTGAVCLVALPWAANSLLPGEEWLGIVGLIPLAGGAATWLLMEVRRTRAAAAAFGLTATLMVTAAFALVADRVSQHQQNTRLLAAIDARGRSINLASFGMLEPTWVFYGRRPVHEIHPEGQPLRNWVEVGQRWQEKPPLQIEHVVNSSDDWLIITSDVHLDHLRRELPDDFRVVQRVPYFLKGQQLLLLGRTSQRLAERPSHEGH